MGAACACRVRRTLRVVIRFVPDPAIEPLRLRRPWSGLWLHPSIAAIGEGLLAGSEVGVRFSELVLPPVSPPLWVWAIIGALYYLLSSPS